MDLSPIELVEAAASSGYDQVSLFTNAPVVPLAGQESKFVFPTVTPETKREVLERLEANGLSVINAEFFLMRPDVELASYVPGLALGRELGARNAMTHIFEADPSRAVDLLGAFCELAAAEDLNVAIEFCQMTPGCKSIEQATWFVEQVGKANLGFGICPMHLVRSGGTAADIAALDERYLLYGQINDGHGTHVSSAYFEEVHDRQLPGNGDFPLHDILSALPADAPIEVKCPSDSRRKAGRSALAYVRDAFALSRPLVDGLTPGR
jgi:sugar phosphate isomerase/epimerase